MSGLVRHDDAVEALVGELVVDAGFGGVYSIETGTPGDSAEAVEEVVHTLLAGA